jgi:hypothetical protein
MSSRFFLPLALLVSSALSAQPVRGSGPEDTQPTSSEPTANLTPEPHFKWTELPARKRGPAILALLSFAVGVADIEFTQHCLRIETCQEANPFLPPGRPAQYAVKTAISTSFFFMGWGLRGSSHPLLRKLWWLPQAAWIGAQAYGVWTGARFYSKPGR